MRRFSLLSIDLPWSYSDKLRQSKTKRGAEDVYTSQLCYQEFFALPIAQLAATNAVLWMWTTSSHLELAFPLLRAWGFQYKQLGVWGKIQKGDRSKPKIGMGRTFRQSVEPGLLATRGRVANALALKNQSNLFLEPVGKHSQKPEAVQDALEAMFPTFDRRLEMFARRVRPGWTCIGDAVDGLHIRDSIALLQTRPTSYAEAAE